VTARLGVRNPGLIIIQIGTPAGASGSIPLACSEGVVSSTR
jgi:hypothetical protein